MFREVVPILENQMEKRIGNVKGNSVEAWGYTDSAMQGSDALPIYLGLGLLIAKVIIG